MTQTDVVFHRPETIAAALSILSSAAPRPAIPLAGGTWIMRAALRGEDTDKTFVSLANIASLHSIEKTDGGLTIGAMVSHAALAQALGADPAHAGLRTACAASANPAVRHRATIGGNLCSDGFMAPDLVPALMALGAMVTLQAPSGERRLPIADFLRGRGTHPAAEILTHVHLPPPRGTTAHARALLRQAGEYPVAVVSVLAHCRTDGTCQTLRIALSAVEPAPRRWAALENALLGRPLDPVAARDAAQAHLQVLHPRDGVDAAGWYRARLLPQLVERAFADLTRPTAQRDPQ